MKLINSTIAASLLALSGSVNGASIITVGNLITDDATNFITDTSSGRLYTRFDAFDLTYAQTQAAISPGGVFQAWSIATANIADDFIAAMLGVSTTACTGQVGNGTTCGTLTGWVDGALGLSFSASYDYFVYENLFGGSGQVEISPYGLVKDYERWTNSLTGADNYSGSASISYLLYTDVFVNPVPVPAAVWLFGSGLIGLVGFARRKKA